MSWDALTLTGLAVTAVMITATLYLAMRDNPT